MGQTDNPPYGRYTVQNYNETIKRTYAHRRLSLLGFLLCGVVAAVLFPQGPLLHSDLDSAFLILRFVWVIPIPFLVLYIWAMQKASFHSLRIDSQTVSSHKLILEGKHIIFTLVTNGRNIEAVKDSVNSVLHWCKSISPEYISDSFFEIWVITEAPEYNAHEENWKALSSPEVKIFAVPGEYQTKNGSRFKTRALQYSVEIRRRMGLNRNDVWIYHQDDETMVGEDTVLGILDFVADAADDRVFGTGMILYPQNWRNRASYTEELLRSSFFDFLNMESVRRGTLGSPVYHGSHFLCRAETEDQIGWDFGPNALTEDAVFISRLRTPGRNLVGWMRGFAYEQAPFTIHDLLRQRRRWILGAVSFLRRRDTSAKAKISISGGLALWFLALPILITVVLSLVFQSGGIFVGSGFLIGFIAFSLFEFYRVGFSLNQRYIESAVSSLSERCKFVFNCTLGLLADLSAPWYALLHPTSAYETIRKDYR